MSLSLPRNDGALVVDGGPHGARPLTAVVVSPPQAVGWIGFCAFMVGVLQHVTFQALGQVFCSELLLLALTPLLLFDRFYRQRTILRAQQAALWGPMTWLLLSLMVTFVGYFISDLYRNNAPEDFLRGWARIIFLGIDLLGVGMLVSISRANLWRIVCGFGIGGIVVLALKGVPFSMWKLGYCEPVSALVLALVCLARTDVWRLVPLLALGLLDIAWDYRSEGAFVMLIALAIWINGRTRRGGGKALGIALALILVVGAIGGTYFATQNQFSSRRHQSNSGRLSNAIVGFSAVLESPIIGYGSFGRDSRFAKLFADVTFRMLKMEESPLYDLDAIQFARIPAHSQMLTAWIEGGMLGITFFLCYLYWLCRGIRVLLFQVRNVVLLPMLGYFMISGLWALFMSPFGGTTRFSIAIACIAAVIACQLAKEGVAERLAATDSDAVK